MERSANQLPAVESGQVLRQYFDRMLRALGPQGWWPGRTRLEVIVGAILVQNTAWQNAALALRKLKQNGLLTLPGLKAAGLGELQACVRSAGFYRQKACTIRHFLDWLEGACGGSLNTMFLLPAADLRRHLLEIKGLGPETADAILLYAGRHPVFVADSYTRRILSRHAMVPPRAGYTEVQEFLHRYLPGDHALFNEYHALLVEVGKKFCKRQVALCGECPLEEFLTQRESPCPSADGREANPAGQQACSPARLTGSSSTVSELVNATSEPQ